MLMIKLLYGSVLRVSECLRLRVKDVDFEQHQPCFAQRMGSRVRKKNRLWKTYLQSLFKRRVSG